MKVFTKNAELARELGCDAGITGLVPTMGALHEGHLSLVERCRRECGRAVVSVFVNPTQFNDPNDLRNYPRTEEADLALLEKAGVDYVLMPSVEDIYPQQDTRVFDLGTTDKVMEGAQRPGHFNGVAQIVSRLFDIVQPEKAYFGEKDFQQIAVIREMVRRYDYPVEIVPCPIVRGADGLALSSRNMLLTPEHRAAAPAIFEALSTGAARARTMSVEEFRRWVTERIDATQLLKTEYFSVVNARTLEAVDTWSDSFPIRGCIAVQAGRIRLIDNIAIP